MKTFGLKNGDNTKSSASKRTCTVQPKLMVNTPGDHYEREADVMAEHVVRMNQGQQLPKVGSPPITRLIARSLMSNGSVVEPQNGQTVVVQLNASQNDGRPLPQETRRFMETAFSTDFSRVRIHTGGLAAAMNRSIHANAFTYGNDIYFNDGQYAPESAEGKKLLAHELTHVVQQTYAGLHIQRKAAPGNQMERQRREQELYWNRRLTANQEDQVLVVEESFSIWVLDMLARDHSIQDILKTIALGQEFTGSEEARFYWAKRAQEIFFQGQNNQEVRTFFTNSDVPIGTDEPFREIETPVTAPVEPMESEILTSEKEDGEPSTAASTASGASPTDTEAASQEEAKAPSNPGEDRDFQHVKKQVERTADQQKKPVASAEEKKTQISPAARLPDSEKNQQAQGEVLNELERKTYTVDDFLKDFNKKIEIARQEKKPIPPGNRLDVSSNHVLEDGTALKASLTQDARSIKEAGETDLERLKRGLPDPPAAVELVQDNPGAAPNIRNPQTAAPKPKTDHEVSMEAEIRSLDEVLEQDQVPDRWLRDSENPEYQESYRKKEEAQEEFKKTVDNYRRIESSRLEKSGAEMKTNISVQTTSAHQLRKDEFSGGFANQQEAVKNIQGGQKNPYGKKDYFDDIEAAYQTTKTAVKEKLDQLPGIEEKFTGMVNEANENFKKRANYFLGYLYPSWYVVRQMWPDSENERRAKVQKDYLRVATDLYGPIEGITQAKKWSEEYIYERLRIEFIEQVMDSARRIANEVVGLLNGAKEEIRRGKEMVDDAWKRLGHPDKEDRDVEMARASIQSRFENLGESIDESKNSLLDEMTASYIETEKGLRNTFDKLAEQAKKSWLEKAYEAVKDAAVAIASFASSILKLLGRMVHLLGDIVTAPIFFFETLSAGIKQGFFDFVGHIDRHLAAAFFDWLRGKSNLPIEVPETLDGGGIFHLVGQLLGLNRDTFWERVEVKFGKKAADLLRKGEGVLHQGLEIFQILMNEGIGGLWRYVRDSLGNFLSEAIEELKKMVLYSIIEKVLKRIALLFSPGGGFVAIVKMVVAALKFLFNNMERIFQLINTFMDTLEDAVAGRVQAIAEKVVDGLRQFITISIDFLAQLFGFGDLAGKARRFLERLRNPVIRAIDFGLEKVAFLVRKLFGREEKQQQTIPREGGSLEDTQVGELLNFNVDGDRHQLWVDSAGPGVEVMIRSTPMTVGKKLDEWDGKVGQLGEEDQGKAKSLLPTARSQYRLVLKEGAEAEKEMQEALSRSTEAQEVREAEKADDEVEGAEKRLKDTLKALFEVFGEDYEDLFQIPLRLKKYIGQSVLAKTGEPRFLKVFESDIIDTGYIPVVKNQEEPSKRQFSIRRTPDAVKRDAPKLSVNDGILEMGEQKAPDHKNYVPLELAIVQNSAGNYTAAYKTKSYDGEPGPDLEVSISFTEVLEGMPNKRQTRTVEGRDLKFKPEGNPRGQTDSAVSGFHNAHLIGDRFGGSGLNQGLNIYPSSSKYNVSSLYMLGKENEMAAFLASKGSDFRYDMKVTAQIDEEIKEVNHLEALLKKEFSADTNKDYDIQQLGNKLVDDAEARLTNALRIEIQKDISDVPGQFLKVQYTVNGIDWGQIEDDPDYEELVRKMGFEKTSDGVYRKPI